MAALILEDVAAHRLEPATDALLAALDAGQREIQSAVSLGGYGAGLTLTNLYVQITPRFLDAAGPQDDALCARLQHAASPDWITPDQLRDRICRDVESRCHDLLTLPTDDRVPPKEWPANRQRVFGEGRTALLLKSKATVNLFHVTLREFLPLFLSPAPDRRSSVAALADRWKSSAAMDRFLPNSEGRLYVADEVSSLSDDN